CVKDPYGGGAAMATAATKDSRSRRKRRISKPLWPVGGPRLETGSAKPPKRFGSSLLFETFKYAESVRVEKQGVVGRFEDSQLAVGARGQDVFPVVVAAFIPASGRSDRVSSKQAVVIERTVFVFRYVIAGVEPAHQHQPIADQPPCAGLAEADQIFEARCAVVLVAHSQIAANVPFFEKRSAV